MKRLLPIILFLLISSHAYCERLLFQPYSKADTTRQLIFTSLVIVDWIQTCHMITNDFYRDFDEYGGGYYQYESNPLLGKYPTVKTVTGWCLLSVTSHALLTYAMPKKWRPYWQWVSIGVEGYVVTGNFTIRAGIKLPLF